MKKEKADMEDQDWQELEFSRSQSKEVSLIW